MKMHERIGSSNTVAGPIKNSGACRISVDRTPLFLAAAAARGKGLRHLIPVLSPVERLSAESRARDA
jgi:hypothetical protein